MVSVMRTDPPLLVSANEDRGLGTAIGFRNAADLQKPDQQKQRAGTGLSKGDDVCIMVYRGIKESDIIWGFIGEYRVTTEGRKIGIPSIVEDESKALRFRVMRETMATAV